MALCGRVDPLYLDNAIVVPSLTLTARNVLKAWTSPLQHLAYQGVEQRVAYLHSSTTSALHQMRKHCQTVKLGEPTSEKVDAGRRGRRPQGL